MTAAAELTLQPTAAKLAPRRRAGLQPTCPPSGGHAAEAGLRSCAAAGPASVLVLPAPAAQVLNVIGLRRITPNRARHAPQAHPPSPSRGLWPPHKVLRTLRGPRPAGIRHNAGGMRAIGPWHTRKRRSCAAPRPNGAGLRPAHSALCQMPATATFGRCKAAPRVRFGAATPRRCSRRPCLRQGRG